MSSPPADEVCNPPLGNLEFGLGVFLLVGTLISYLPQHIKLLRMRSHVGLSLGTAVLGAVNNAAALVNYISVEYFQMFDCCAGVDSTTCFGKIMPFLQLIVIYLCSAAIVILYIIFFDKKWCEENGMPVERIWRTTWMTVVATFVIEAIFFLIYGIFAATDGVYGDKTYIYGRVCLIISGVGVILHWVPQIWKTYKFKKIGSLSLPMIFMQGFGALLTAYFFSLSSGWATGFPFALASVLLLILFVLGLYYYIKERQAARVMDQNEETSKLLSTNNDPEFNQ